MSVLCYRDTCNCSIKEDSRNVTCTIVVTGTPDDDGYYGDNCLGNLHNETPFTIKAVNKFGMIEISKSFYVTDYRKFMLLIEMGKMFEFLSFASLFNENFYFENIHLWKLLIEYCRYLFFFFYCTNTLPCTCQLIFIFKE